MKEYRSTTYYTYYFRQAVWSALMISSAINTMMILVESGPSLSLMFIEAQNFYWRQMININSFWKKQHETLEQICHQCEPCTPCTKMINSRGLTFVKPSYGNAFRIFGPRLIVYFHLNTNLHFSSLVLTFFNFFRFHLSPSFFQRF